MDKKRAAMRQARAIEAQAERLAAIEQVLVAPQVIDPAALAESEPMATAAQMEAIEQRLAAIETQLTPASDIVNAFSQVMNELGAIQQLLAQALKPQPQQPKR